MNAMKIALYIFVFVLSSAIINGSGLFSTSLEAPNANIPSATLDSGITDISSGSSSLEDIESTYNGGTMVRNVISTVMSIFEILTVPYLYLMNTWHTPYYVAYAIQAVVTFSETWGLLQILRNINTKGMD